jgi:hypothetical protein
LAPCDAVLVSSVDSSKLFAKSTIGWRCGSLVFFQCFCRLLRFTRDIGRFCRLAMPRWSPAWIPRNCSQNRPCGGAVGRSYFSDVFVDSCVSLGTLIVFAALRCRGGRQRGFLETLRKLDHVVALRFARLFPMFSWSLAFHSGRLLLWAPCDAVAVSRVGFLDTVRRFGHVVALRFARLFPMFWRTLAFHSEPPSLLAPCDAVLVSSVGSSKQQATSLTLPTFGGGCG